MRSFYLLLIICCLSACGFHLRGDLHIPQSAMPVAVISQKGHTPLERLLESQLGLQNVRVTNDIQQARYRIVLLEERMRQDITAVAASTAPRQYQLTYQVLFRFDRPIGKKIEQSQVMRVSVNRLLTVNNDRILGSDSESTLLRNEMKADVATQILARFENSLYIVK